MIFSGPMPGRLFYRLPWPHRRSIHALHPARVLPGHPGWQSGAGAQDSWRQNRVLLLAVHFCFLPYITYLIVKGLKTDFLYCLLDETFALLFVPNKFKLVRNWTGKAFA
jgi:hypothetical protein